MRNGVYKLNSFYIGRLLPVFFQWSRSHTTPDSDTALLLRSKKRIFSRMPVSVSSTWFNSQTERCSWFEGGLATLRLFFFFCHALYLCIRWRCATAVLPVEPVFHRIATASTALLSALRVGFCLFSLLFHDGLEQLIEITGSTVSRVLTSAGACNDVGSRFAVWLFAASSAVAPLSISRLAWNNRRFLGRLCAA